MFGAIDPAASDRKFEFGKDIFQPPTQLPMPHQQLHVPKEIEHLPASPRVRTPYSIVTNRNASGSCVLLFVFVVAFGEPLGHAIPLTAMVIRLTRLAGAVLNLVLSVAAAIWREQEVLTRASRQLVVSSIKDGRPRHKRQVRTLKNGTRSLS